MKNIKDFIVGDIIYMRKNRKGHMVDLKCNFLGIKKGCIIGEIKEIYPLEYKFYYPTHLEVKTKKEMCFIKAERIFDNGLRSADSYYWLNSKTGGFE